MDTATPLQQLHQVDASIGLDDPLWSTQNPLFGKAGALGKGGINTLWELLYTLPRDHMIFKPTPINELPNYQGEWVLVEGTLMRYEVKSSPKNQQLTIQTWQVHGRGGKLRAVEFDRNGQHASQGWRNAQRQYWQRHYGHKCLVKGKVKVSSRTWNGLLYTNVDLEKPEIIMAQAGQGITEELTPIYLDTKSLGAEVLQECVRVGLGILDALLTSGQHTDPLPQSLTAQHQICDLQEALEGIHFPDSQDDLNAAKQRLIYEDFFYLQLALLYRKSLYQQTETLEPPIIIRPGLVDLLIEGLPYDLTHAQQRVIGEILGDMASSRRMTRLVQGDVGSGKTVVAATAIARCIEYGQQAALMVPTEVLAEQHYRKLYEWLYTMGLNVALLTGSTRAKTRRAILTDLNGGTLDVIVGTHALIEDEVVFRDLGLVVIDEQHRFGVEQRTQLQQKGNPHLLSMTATPIPRTLALTLHGDLDVSQIDELPPGRTPIQTVVYQDNDTNRRNIEQFCLGELQEGRQVYVILPLVEKNDKLNLKAATEEYERLQQVFPNHRVGLLHGKLKSKEKTAILNDFAQGTIQVLVSTTVVEVGVDVPNATIILIEHAERFGLAQLHQLRGRVGRGIHESFCLLISSSSSDEACERLSLMEQHTNGLVLAEYDLQNRGSGELMGTEQHGEQRFIIADLARDLKWLERARSDAQRIVADPSTLSEQEWESLITECKRRGYDLFGERGD